MKQKIQTSDAPQAIGTYSQGIKVNNLVFVSGQIGLDPHTGMLVGSDFEAQATQVLQNLEAVAQAAGGEMTSFLKLTVYLTDLTYFPMLNNLMAKFFSDPYPARATLEVSSLPKGALVEIEGILAV